MNKIKVSFDYKNFSSKPTNLEIKGIHSRIATSIKQLDSEDIKSFALAVGSKGYTFCPATFKNNERKKENFKQQQFFALDFDNKNTMVSFEEIKKRAEYYNLPILFAYDTFSSTNHDKFRIVFLNDVSISHQKVATGMQLALGTIFPEADSSCYNDISKMYFGGKSLLYYDENIPKINIESMFRNFSYYLKKKYKANHYKEKISKFSQKTGIALNRNGLLDVTMSYDSTEDNGASLIELNKNRKNSPNTIIYTLNNYNIIANGEIFPKIHYFINLNDIDTIDSTINSSVVSSVENKNFVKNHNFYRASVLSEMSKRCRLFKEFETSKRNLNHNELFGLATNLIQVETGSQKFKMIQAENTVFFDDKRRDKWEYTISYIKQYEYKPQHCTGFCPYHEECNHSNNILSTVHPKRGTIEKISGYNEKLYSLEEVQEDTYNAIYQAYHSNDKQFQIINSMTAAGKSTSYLRLMSENPTERFLIATPTNLLKDEIYSKAKKMDINVRKTPSLEQIKDKIPNKIWKHIQKLYKSGDYHAVHPYIRKILEKKEIPCLRKYLNRREKLKSFSGCIITTHRYLLNMSEKELKEYAAIIIDEDIIFKSALSNQGEITRTELEELLGEVTDIHLIKKIKKLLKFAKTKLCIKLKSFEWNNEEEQSDIAKKFDIPSFCLAEHFYLRRKINEENIEEDTVAFLKPITFKNVKYIMVSATADENICQKYFGIDNVNFYRCKRAAYKGNLNQYPNKSMSRTCLANNHGIIQRLMKQLCISEDKIITFMKENIGHLHFGNTEGSNILEGKDILVVGTPYHTEFLYKLAAFSMGLDFDEAEKMSSQLVTYNGYRFWFTTFENEELRAIHFWMIESELEQAVGRARLLRNVCEAHLFSNFPLSQANMIYNFDYDKD